MERDGRRILLEGIHNCRDLGGLQNADGQKIREGLLLRSGHLCHATAEDARCLKESFSLCEILDLRNMEEQRELPDAPIPGAEHVEMPIFPDFQQGITHEKKLPAYEIYPPMSEIYVRFITVDYLNRNMARAVKRVLTHDYDRGAILWHCFGGKDRCGMVASLTLSVLGVPYPTIMEDYMMTNIEGRSNAENARRAVLERGGPQKEADFEYDANIARESYLNNAFNAIRERFGDPVSFLKKAGDITEDEMEQFRRRMLEEP